MIWPHNLSDSEKRPLSDAEELELLDRNSVCNKPLPCNSGQREQNAKVCKYVDRCLSTTDRTDGTQYLQPFYASLSMGNKVKS